MKRMNNWSILGLVCGAIFSIISFIQYYVLYRDIDRIIAYPIIGILIMAVSYLYHSSIKHGDTIEAMSEYLADKQNENK